MRTSARGVVVAVPLLAATLAGCGDVEVAVESEVPTPLVDPLPITVGVYYSERFSKYSHAEERWGVDWKAELGPYHVRMAQTLFAAAFRETIPVTDLTALPANPAYVAIIEPQIEQYSFITPKDTGANYYAVTIKYRLNLLAPNGSPADSLTFTGYGSFKSGGITSTAPMMRATKAAMRDAAAKFLVQFPEQEVARKMVAGAPLIETPAPVVAAGTTSVVSAPDNVVIATVPIVDKPPAPATAPDPGAVPGTADPAPSPEEAGGESTSAPDSAGESTPVPESAPETSPPAESSGDSPSAPDSAGESTPVPESAPETSPPAESSGDSPSAPDSAGESTTAPESAPETSPPAESSGDSPSAPDSAQQPETPHEIQPDG